jgi:hypothetical protein
MDCYCFKRYNRYVDKTQIKDDVNVINRDATMALFQGKF